MDAAELARQLKALSDPTRIRILELLPREAVCRDMYNVSELAEELGVPQPNVSHHLGILSRSGLVKSTKMCRDVYYSIDAAAFRAAMDALTGVIGARR